MIHFPVFHHLCVKDYLLFPGSEQSRGLNVTFEKGPTLIAGVNGLGKSTLIAIMLRAVTGPFDIPKSAQDGDLGEVEPSPSAIIPQLVFAPRVADGAENAIARLEMSFAGRRMRIERKLADLSLVNCQLGDGEEEITDEEGYQASLSTLMGVGSFFDALLIFRYVIFFLEERRALVWGKTAQREILRALFVEPEMAAELSGLRYAMMSADSSFRNLRSVLNKRIKENRREIERVTSVSDVRARLAVLGAELTAGQTEESELQESVAREEAARLDARLRGAKAALDRDSALRELERAKVQSLRGSFTELEESGLYVLSRLLSHDQCLVCDTQKAGLGKFVEKRLGAGCCPVCGSEKKVAPTEDVVNLTVKRIKELQYQIRLGEEQVRASDHEVRRADAARQMKLERLSATTNRKLDLGEEIRRLRARLPKEERSASDLDERNRELQCLIDEEQARYKVCRAAFETAQKDSEQAVAATHKEVAKAFENFARHFLKEKCRIAFQPVRVRIGQSGSDFEIRLFQLSMTGGAVAGETPRAEPDQVSMSQREFLDLAFRMALMTVASEQQGAATLVVDTPESSLDFLFAERAGNQLASFAKFGGTIGNRVIITSNLTNAEMIPAFLKARPKRATAASHVVDLLELAASSAAVREDRAKYTEFLANLIKKS